jgi:hypothetical protein
MGCVEQKGGVHAAGKGHHHRAQVPKEIAQLLILFVQSHHVTLVHNSYQSNMIFYIIPGGGRLVNVGFWLALANMTVDSTGDL